MYWHEDALQKVLASAKPDEPPASPPDDADGPDAEEEKGGDHT
jgi:hypothetical protein